MASVTNRNHHFLSSRAHSVGSVLDRILAARPLLFLSSLAFVSTLIYGFGFVPIANLFVLYIDTPLKSVYIATGRNSWPAAPGFSLFSPGPDLRVGMVGLPGTFKEKQPGWSSSGARLAQG